MKERREVAAGWSAQQGCAEGDGDGGGWSRRRNSKEGGRGRFVRKEEKRQGSLREGCLGSVLAGDSPEIGAKID